jgi:hypothetical protein
MVTRTQLWDVAIAAVIPLYIGAKLSRERSGASLRSENLS